MVFLVKEEENKEEEEEFWVLGEDRQIIMAYECQIHVGSL